MALYSMLSCIMIVCMYCSRSEDAGGLFGGSCLQQTSLWLCSRVRLCRDGQT